MASLTMQMHRTYSHPIQGLPIVLSRNRSHRDHNISDMGTRKRHRRGSQYILPYRDSDTQAHFRQNRMAAVRNGCTQLQPRGLTNG
jgi:hypothetical protein